MVEIRVVIIEDHHATRRGLEAELNSEPDIVVVGSSTGHNEGLALVHSSKPDVVLLDLHLPDSPGPKSVTAAYANLGTPRVIVFSGDSRPAILQLVLDSGVSGYLLKSEPVPEVADAIRKVMKGETVISADLRKNEQQKLTAAERDVLKFLARGMKYQEIAAKRVTSPETVRKQVEQLLYKLQINSREELIAWAVSKGYGGMDSE